MQGSADGILEHGSNAQHHAHPHASVPRLCRSDHPPRRLEILSVHSRRSDLQIDDEEIEAAFLGQIEMMLDCFIVLRGVAALLRPIRDSGILGILIPVTRRRTGVVPRIIMSTEERTVSGGGLDREFAYACRIFKQFVQFIRGAVPGVVCHCGGGLPSHGGGEGGIAEQSVQPPGDALRVRLHDNRPVIAENLHVSTLGADDHRQAGGGGFERHHPERFTQRHIDAAGGFSIDTFDIRLRESAMEHHSVGNAQSGGQGLQFVPLRSLSDDVKIAVRHQSDGLDHEFESLVRPESPDVHSPLSSGGLSRFLAGIDSGVGDDVGATAVNVFRIPCHVLTIDRHSVEDGATVERLEQTQLGIQLQCGCTPIGLFGIDMDTEFLIAVYILPEIAEVVESAQRFVAHEHAGRAAHNLRRAPVEEVDVVLAELVLPKPGQDHEILEQRELPTVTTLEARQEHLDQS